jgi:hypothetical protein
MVFDKEKSAATSIATELMRYIKRHFVRAAFTDLPPIPMNGSDRQQWLMFWADNFTSSEYIGFVDSDTVFSSVVTGEDLFVDGKPRAIVVYGRPLNEFWETVPSQTFYAIGKKEPFKGMSFFPVVIKTAHLELMRNHIYRTVGVSHFDMAFGKIMNRGRYSQFGIMVSYLWYFHRNEYFWDIIEQEEGWSGPVPSGQIETLEEGGLTQDMLNQGKPRSSIHWSYESTFERSKANYTNILKTGYCYHQSLFASPDSAFCKTLDTTRPSEFEWTFEGTSYLGRSHVVSAHKERQNRIRKGCQNQNFDWEPEMLRSMVGTSVYDENVME